MSKRSSPDSDGESTGESSSKRSRLVEFEPVRIASVSGVKDVNAQVLAVQNYKLSERLRHKENLRESLQRRCEQLERRQTQDDAMLCIINRHWNRLDEDVRILLQRFDAEAVIEEYLNGTDVKDGAKSFLNELSERESDEIDENLKQRVEFSRRAIAKLVQVFDHIMQRNEAVSTLITACSVSNSADDQEATTSIEQKPSKEQLDEAISSQNAHLQAENQKLQTLLTKLQAENRRLTIQAAARDDKMSIMETRSEEMSNELEEAKYELQKTMRREDKLDFKLAESLRKEKNAELLLIQLREQVQTTTNGIQSMPNDDTETASVSKSKLEEMQFSLEQESDLAANRLSELQELLGRLSAAQTENDRLRAAVMEPTPEVVARSTPFICLQSQFSILFLESNKMKQQLDEARAQIVTLKTTHAKQVEQMEGEELLAQERLREAMLELEDQLSQVRKEYEMMRVEFEQNLAANEQSGPVTREMRQLLGSYKTQNQQLKQEVNRFKRKWKEAVSLVAKGQKELDQERQLRERSLLVDLEGEEPPVSSPCLDSSSDTAICDGEEASCAQHSALIANQKKRIVDLNCQVEAVNGLTNDQRERIELLTREKRLKMECDRLQNCLKKLASTDRKEKVKFYSDEANARLRQYEEQMERLKKEAASSKQEEDTLLNEMEVTGQAFEEMQEQNTRLLQQLKEKDDANLKLMAERIRFNQHQKKMKEEKELLDEQVGSLNNQVEAQNIVVRKLEEKERLFVQNLNTLEAEIRMRQQALDLHRRKAIEHAQSAADLKLQLEKCSTQLAETQQAVATKTTAIEVDNFKIRRLEEEKSVMRKRLERAKKLEKADKVDEVLMEEIRELKEQLTCPSCKVRRKDAILTKCFHVFCMECLRTRYETRRRKCPKCNAAFGAHDYHRIYIG